MRTSSPSLSPRLVLALLILLHLAVVSLYVAEVIPQQFNPPDHLFWFHNGGDNADYFRMAVNITHGQFEAIKYPIGFPLTLLPFIAIFQPRVQEDILQPVSAFWALVMFPVGQLLLYRLALLLTGRPSVGLWAVFLWTILPLPLHLALLVLTSPVIAETSSVHLIWAQMLSDGPATLLTILAFVLYCEWRARARTGGRSFRWALALGVALGALVLVRYTGALSGAVVVLLLLAERRWRALLTVGAAAALVLLPQLVYNLAAFGDPFTTGYTALDVLPPYGLFSLRYLTDAAGALGPTLIPVVIGAALAGAAFALGTAALWRWQRLAAILTTLWIGGIVALYSLYYYSWNGGMFRFLMPMYPAAALVGAALVVSLASRRAPAPQEPPAAVL
jgi:4-amino-4-deoxy-L-arabinose transferase-like glycosyltransferase